MSCRHCYFDGPCRVEASDDFRTKTRILWRHCDVCGFISQLPYVTDSVQASQYGTFDVLDPEFKPWHDWEGLVQSCRFNAEIMDEDRDMYPQKRYLEVAAFSGFLMKNMKDRGWNVRGQELTAHGCAQAALHDLKVECASVFDWEPNQEFDVISCREFIEHVWDYRELLRRCFRWQAKGGALWIQTPVTDTHKDHSNKIAYQADHVSLFRLENLHVALMEVGYEVTRSENRDGCGIVKAVKRTCPA